jgi:maleylacetate reductase
VERDFTFRDGERTIRFAAGTVEESPGLLAGHGFEGYALLTTERASADAPAVVEGADAVLHVPQGPVPEIAAAVRSGVEGRPVVALGGGRVVDAGKAIASADDLRCAAIPTTLAGSSFTPFHRLPAPLEGYGFVRPALVVADPELMASLPEQQLAATAMNALAHASESLYAPGANPVAEGAALRAAELFASGLAPGDLRREDLALAALLGGWAVGTTGLSLHHALCQTIVRTAGTPHALTNAVMLPHTLRFMAGRAPDELRKLARALGSEGRNPVEAGDAVALLAARSGVTHMDDLGLGAGAIPAIAQAALQHPGIAAMDPTPAEPELRELLETAL